MRRIGWGVMLLACAGCNGIFGLDRGQVAGDAPDVTGDAAIDSRVDDAATDSAVDSAVDSGVIDGAIDALVPDGAADAMPDAPPDLVTVEWSAGYVQASLATVSHTQLVSGPAPDFHAYYTSEVPLDGVAAADTDTAKFPRQPGAMYRVTRTGAFGIEEFQSTRQTVRLSDIAYLRPGPADMGAMTALKFTNHKAPADAAAVYTTGTWTSTRLGSSRGRLDWVAADLEDPVAPRALLASSEGERVAYVTFAGRGGTQYTSMDTFQELVPPSMTTMTDNPVTYPVAVTTLSQTFCAHVDFPFADINNRFKGADATGQLKPPPASEGEETRWTIKATPPEAMGDTLVGRDLASGGGNASHTGFSIKYPLPPELGAWPVYAEASVRYHRVTLIPGSSTALPDRFAGSREVYALPQIPTCAQEPQLSFDASSPVGIPQKLVINGASILSDDQVLSVHNDPTVLMSWSVVGTAQLFRVRLYAVTAAGLVLKRTYLTDATQIVVPSADLLSGSTYTVDIAAYDGFADGTYTTRTVPFGVAEIPMPAFKIL